MFENMKGSWAEAFRSIDHILIGIVKSDGNYSHEDLREAINVVEQTTSNPPARTLVLTYLTHARNSLEEEKPGRLPTEWNYYYGLAKIATAQAIVYEILLDESKKDY